MGSARTWGQTRLTKSRARVRARAKSGAQFSVWPGKEAGTAGVGVGLEPRAPAHWRRGQIAAGIRAGRGHSRGRQSSIETLEIGTGV